MSLMLQENDISIDGLLRNAELFRDRRRGVRSTLNKGEQLPQPLCDSK